MAAWALGRIRAPGAPEALRRLANDSDSVWLYRHGEMVELSISQIARESRKAAMAAETNSHGIL
ncbi:MAG: hypothetical protein BWZ10_01143 [candidate division BRC1 bacterium ADurb.BinA364]|nr:MAG: hypothetical protein BWZ10_01143 [candidate division BRC1 bacterium ADurb.BinA364]